MAKPKGTDHSESLEHEKVFRRLLTVQLHDAEAECFGEFGHFGGRPIHEHTHHLN